MTDPLVWIVSDISRGCSDAVMVKMFLPLLDYPADCTSQEPLILRISDDFIPDDFMHLQFVDKITMGRWTRRKQLYDDDDDVPQIWRVVCLSFAKVEALFDKNWHWYIWSN